MSKLDINALRYLVMEGGGARGTTYLGAIRALEHQLKIKQESNSDTANNQLKLATEGKKIPAILDYVTGAEGEEKAYIKGVAGGSAGAITTFAIALGLNSEEIEKVLEFEFQNFLSETHAGKYRMIGADSSLMIGEDADKTIGNYSKSKVFNYTLAQQKTKVKPNRIKGAKRRTLVGFFVKTIGDGLALNGDRLSFLLNRIIKQNGKETFLNKVRAFLQRNISGLGAIATRLAIGPILKWLIFKVLLRKMPFKVNSNAIGGVLFDRGMYSGFQVREFFYDLLIFAATRDTHFRRNMLKFYNEKTLRTGKVKLTEADFDFPNFTIGDRTGEKSENKVDFSPAAKRVFEHLKDLTFAEFFEITGVDFCAAVSNFSASSPVYFSDKWTPHFRVLEAVSASMSIPPAIRPIFNDSDVYFGDEEAEKEGYELDFPRKMSGAKSLFVSVDNELHKFVDASGKFKKTDYQLYEYIVKKALQSTFAANNKGLDEQVQVDFSASKAKAVYVDLNNVIDLNTFLPKLRDIVVGDRNRETSQQKRASFTEKVYFEGKEYKVSRELLTFFYNAQYKGLLFDGGYLNNIPYNYFRNLATDELDGVLAIKLDRSFPPTFMAGIHKRIQSYLTKEQQLEKALQEYRMKSFLNNESSAVLDSVTEEYMNRIDAEFEKLITFVTIQFGAYFNNQEDILDQLVEEQYAAKNLSAKKRKRKIRKAQKVDRASVVEFIDAWVKENGKSNYVKPWAVPKSILQTAFEGYSYGSERGQVRSFTDHDHIIPLYDFGVGTYDFDLSKVRPMAKKAQVEAEIAVHQYFS